MKFGGKKSGKDSSESDQKEGGEQDSDYEVEVDDEDVDERDHKLTTGTKGKSAPMKFDSSSKTGNKNVRASKVREEDLDDSELDEEAPDGSTSRARGSSPTKRHQAVIDENEEDGNQITDNQSDK
jgi:hypothetical protein